jgi:hypothetical protein
MLSPHQQKIMENNSLNGVQPGAPPESYDDMQEHVLRVNFGLSWKHIAAVVFGLPAFAGSLVTAGWLVMPAKQSDVTRIEQQLTGVSNQVNGLQEISLKLTTAVDALAANVERMTTQPALQVVPKPRRKP